nr:hypothetical protein GCM10010200_032710 [Actinomadura rugatobispora]
MSDGLLDTSPRMFLQEARPRGRPAIRGRQVRAYGADALAGTAAAMADAGPAETPRDSSASTPPEGTESP